MSNQGDDDESITFPNTFPEGLDLNDSFAADIGDFMADFDISPQQQTQGPVSMDLSILNTTLKKVKCKSKATKKSKSFAASKQQKNDNLKDRPKRALSSYNIFFAMERQKLLAETPVRAIGKPRKSHGKVGFAEMAKTIASNWKTIDPHDKLYFEGLAAKDNWRYNMEMGEWAMARQEAKRAQEAAQQAPVTTAAASACAFPQPSHQRPVQVYTPPGNASDAHSSIASQQQQELDLFNVGGAFDEGTPIVPKMPTSTFGNMMLPAIIKPMMISSPDEQQPQQGGNALMVREAMARDSLLQLQEQPSSSHLMLPEAAPPVSATNSSWAEAPSCSSTAMTRNMYNLSSKTSTSSNQNIHIPSLSYATSIFSSSSPSSRNCMNYSNSNEGLVGLARNMDRDCINLFINMLNTPSYHEDSSSDNNVVSTATQ